MTNHGDEPAAKPDWAAAEKLVRRGGVPYDAICARFGIPRKEFDARRKAEGWKRKLVKTENTAQTIRRLKDLLHKRLADLEGQLAAIGADVSAAESEREIKSMNTLVRTLEKVLELERKHSASAKRRSGGLRIVDNARRLALAARIAALSPTWRDPDDPGEAQAG